MDTIDLAKIAYAAYGGTTNHLNFRGEPMPSWENLPLKIQEAWMAAANAVSIATIVSSSPTPLRLVDASEVRVCPHCSYIWPPSKVFGRCPGCQQIYEG